MCSNLICDEIHHVIACLQVAGQRAAGLPQAFVFACLSRLLASTLMNDAAHGEQIGQRLFNGAIDVLCALRAAGDIQSRQSVIIRESGKRECRRGNAVEDDRAHRITGYEGLGLQARWQVTPRRFVC